MRSAIDRSLGQMKPVVDTRAVRRIGVKIGSGRDLSQAMQKVLIGGLFISAGLMIFGLLLGLMTSRIPPAETLRPVEAFRQALELRPSGFFSLGLIALILTPLLRVIGSLLVFLWERDWRYAGITLLVLAEMLLSVLIAQS